MAESRAERRARRALVEAAEGPKEEKSSKKSNYSKAAKSKSAKGKAKAKRPGSRQGGDKESHVHSKGSRKDSAKPARKTVDPKSPCSIMRACGGCTALNRPYKKQLAAKQAAMEELFASLCEREGIAVDPIRGMGVTLGDPGKYPADLSRILPRLFEDLDGSNSFSELLIVLSFNDPNGVVYRLVNEVDERWFDIHATDEDGKPMGQVQIMGWMYQYYNTEPKDKVFADLKKNIKISKQNIPAATQLFTPDWIVRYMVENSLGRLWVEGHPDCDLKENWKYYLEEAQQEPEVQVKLSEIRKEYAALNPEDIKLIDPCMGSGHILVYAFDVLMQIYESAGYSQRDAAKSILEHNIYGLDIDDRAYQLAYFAVMMKARQYNRRILNGENTCHVYAIQESNSINRAHLNYFGAGMDDIEKNAAKMQLEGLLDTLTDAKEYGSILNVENYNWDLLRRFVAAEDTAGQISMDSVGVEDTAEQLNRLIDIGETMARKYWVTCTNPPYAGTSNLSANVNNFVKKNYPDSKADLFAVFIERCRAMTADNGYQAMITQHSWMFLSSFEKLRGKLLHTDIVNMAHLGARAFEEIGGEVVQTTSFVIRKHRWTG